MTKKSLDNNNNNKIFRNIVYSSLATSIAELATLPICTIKTNYQNTHSNSIINTAKSIYSRGGIKPFYAASVPAIFGQVFSTTSKYTIYRYLDSNPNYPIKNKFMNGMTAGLISSLFTHPLDVTKVHLQMCEPLIKQVRQSGPMIFYRGYSKTFAKIAISSSLFFPLYDYFQQKIESPILSSGVSAIVATVCMQPVDYLKTRHIAGLPLYNGWHLTTYYKGISLNLMRIVPHFMITMSLIEWMKMT
jgi:hypothetical protein